MDIARIIKICSEEVQPAQDWYLQLYEDNFGSYFEAQHELNQRILSSDDPITDKELESILIDLPMQMFEVSEIVNRFKLSLEVLKLSIKQNKESNPDAAIEYEAVADIYQCVLERVANEKSYARELIMSAKKIWESRRNGEGSMPVAPVDPVDDLPAYDVTAGKSYIK